MELISPKVFLILAAVIFSIGVYGVLARRNILIILLSVELMLAGVNLVALTMSRVYAHAGGQVFALVVIAVSAAAVAVGLSILIALFRLKRTTNPADLRMLRG